MQDLSALCLVAAVALAVTQLSAPAYRVLAERTGAIAQVRDRDVHAVPIPYFGGLAMYTGMWAGLLVAICTPILNITQTDKDNAATIVIAAGVVVGYGVLDDIFDLSAWLKITAQVMAGGVLAANDVQLIVVPLPGGEALSLDPAQSGILTIILVVIGVNAVNLIDGLDGLAASVVAVGAAALLIYSIGVTAQSSTYLVFGQATPVVAALLFGCTCGFLIHNLPPARMFMGDSGSLGLGVVLTGAAILATRVVVPTAEIDQTFGFGSTSRLGVFVWVAIPLSVLGIPLLDLTLAVRRRRRAGGSLFVADKKHLHHLLIDSGHTHRTAVAFIATWAAVVSCGTAFFVVHPSVEILVAIVLTSALLVIIELRRLRRQVSPLGGTFQSRTGATAGLPDRHSSDL